jgi:DNA-binding transcriptional MerR regulator
VADPGRDEDASRPAGGAAGEWAELSGIQHVARELGITARTLRFYEDKGLIEPRRIGTMRVYTRREVARVQLILRGKRLGFSLREIQEFLDLYDADPHHVEQMRRLAALTRERIAKLMKQQAAIEQTVAELRAMEREARDRIRAAERSGEG